MTIEYKIDSATHAKITSHFSKCDETFLEDLTKRITVEKYINKLLKNAIKYEAWLDNDLVGLVAIYENFENLSGFITNVSVDKNNTSKGIASKLLKSTIESARQEKLSKIKLKVGAKNYAALNLYEKFGFKISATIEDSLVLEVNLSRKR